MEALIRNKSNFIPILLLIVGICKSGVWLFPSASVLIDLAENPFVQPREEGQYLFESWLSILILWSLNINSIIKFSILFFAVTLCTIWVLWSYIKEVAPQDTSTRVIVAILPLPFTLFYWIGIDALTTLLIVLGFKWQVNERRVILVAILLGFQHFMIGIVGFGALLIYEILRRKKSPDKKAMRFTLLMILGLVLGRSMLATIFLLQNIHISNSRFSIGAQLVGIFSQNISNSNYLKSWVLAIWSILGPIWFVVLYISFRDGISEFWVPIIFISIILFAVTDQSRVGQIATLPILLALLSQKEMGLRLLSSKIVLLVVSLWILIPWRWVWGQTFGSMLGFDLEVIAYLLEEKNPENIFSVFEAWPLLK